MKSHIAAIALLLLFVALPGSPVLASDYDPVRAKLENAMASQVRTPAEMERDQNRKPVETLEFFALRDNMKVVELFPGGGWYTKLLAPVLAENGELYIAFGTSRAQSAVAGQPGFEKIQVTGSDAEISRAEGARFYTASNTDLGVKNVDMVLTFRNYHNFDDASRDALNQSVFKALKPGGIYALVDHTRRHMQADNAENRRRLDPVQAIKEILAAGFEFVDYSDLHYRADDELVYEVGRRTVSGNTDRWTLMFRKPS
tara:strand:- start:81637 stop:82407 length:771 start_codon:yes stop_codon:yes gene_type:complete